MPGKKKKAKSAAVHTAVTQKPSKKVSRKIRPVIAKDRHASKLERRKASHRLMHTKEWEQPAPRHLVGKLAVPKISTKHTTYFEFADNHEKKKKIEFMVTNDHIPSAGYKFVPIGDPTVTDLCKEISREKGAMIFIVSDQKEENARISEHIYRIGYHFRESIVDEVRERLGETVISKAIVPIGFCEPIPETQEEINEQADKAIRDLFPRIPNPDRQRIIDHAFKLGASFHGEPTVGLQANIPLSRRVQLATLAHIRHVHTRYDKLLRETTWMNARKVVEPVCLDVLLNWRGDEETGRDQLEEILREVVVITDSDREENEDSEEASEDEECSDNVGDTTASSSTDESGDSSNNDQLEPRKLPVRSSTLHRAAHSPILASYGSHEDSRPGRMIFTGAKASAPAQLFQTASGSARGIESSHTSDAQLRKQDRLAQKGFHRYQTALSDALQRQKNNNPAATDKSHHRTQSYSMGSRAAQAGDSAQGVETGRPQYFERKPHMYIQQSAPHAPPNQYHPREQAGPQLKRRPDRGEVNPQSIDSGSNPAEMRFDGSRADGYPSHRNPHVLQDFLVPSIEAAPEAELPRALAHLELQRGRGQKGPLLPEGPRPRSPPRLEVVVLDDSDNSPQAKRARLAHADHADAGRRSRLHQSPPPVSYISYDPSRAVASQSTMPYSRPVLDGSGMSRSVHVPQMRVTQEPLPVYDAATGRLLAQHPRDLANFEVVGRSSRDDRADGRLDGHRDMIGLPRERRIISHPTDDRYERVYRDGRGVQRYQRVAEPQRSRSPPYLPSAYASPPRGNGSHEPDGRPVLVDPQFVRRMPQTRVHSNAVQRSDGVIVIREDGQLSGRGSNFYEDDHAIQRRVEGGRQVIYEEAPPYAMHDGQRMVPQARTHSMAEPRRIIYMEPERTYIELD